MPPDADAIVVLGCRIHSSGRPAPPAARRVAAAARAYRDGVAPWVIASGGRRWGAQIEARVLSAELRRAGVPKDVILEELWSLTTCENAIFSEVLLRRLGGRRAAVVTCPWHMRRALQDFRAAGVDAFGVPALFDAGAPSASPRAEPMVARALRRGHEIASMWLDARRMRRPRVLRESAAWLLHTARPADPG